MKICILTTIHSSSDSRVFHKEAKSLSKVHDVVLIAPGEERTDEKIDGINVITVKKPNNKLSHPITMLRVLIKGFKQDCDVYHCHEPGSLFVCAILKAFRRKKLIYDVHEHYASLISNNKIFPGFIRGLIEIISFRSELALSRYADYIIVVRGDLKETFKKVNTNIKIIYVCPDLSVFQPKNVKREDMVVYEGAVDIEKRGMDIFLKSLSIVSKKFDQIKYLVVGTIPESDLIFSMDYLKKNNLIDNFEYTGWIDYNSVSDYLFRAKIGVILLQPIYLNNIMGIPNKLFDYMTSSVPVVASNFPNISEIVNEANCGLLVDPTDPEEVADKILYLLENPEEARVMGENGRRAVERIYNWGNMEERLLELYTEMANESDD